MKIYIAKNEEDLIFVGKLVYSKYLEAGYINDNIFRLWITQFQLYKNSKIFFVEDNKKIVCTATIIFSKENPIPSEFIFESEIQKLKEKYEIAEISCLACEKNIKYIIFLFSEIFNYLKKENKTNYIIISINPKHVSKYKTIGFKEIAKKDNYKYFNVPVVLMGFDITNINKISGLFKKFIDNKVLI